MPVDSGDTDLASQGSEVCEVCGHYLHFNSRWLAFSTVVSNNFHIQSPEVHYLFFSKPRVFGVNWDLEQLMEILVQKDEFYYAHLYNMFNGQ